MLTAQAGPEVVKLAESSNEIYISALFQLRGELFGRQGILFVNDEAACAAMTKGAAEDKVALMIV